MCIDLITKPIITELDVMPNKLIGQLFDSVTATMANDEIPPFVSPHHTHITPDWGQGNVRLNNARVESYNNGAYKFIVLGSITYAFTFKSIDVYRKYCKSYRDLGILQSSNDIHGYILITLECSGDWIQLNKSNIILPTSLID